MSKPEVTYHRGNEWQPDPDGCVTDRDWITFAAPWEGYGCSVNRAADIPDEGFGSGVALGVDLWDEHGEHVAYAPVSGPEPSRRISTDIWAQWVADHVTAYLPERDTEEAGR